MSSMLHPDRVRAHGDAWVDAGLISGEQLDAIRRFEHLEPSRDERRFSIPAEIAVYLGSTLALSGGAIVVAERWDDLPFAARVALAVVLAVVGLAAGAWSYRQGEPGTDRLGGFLTVVGLAGVAFTVALLVDRIADAAEEAVVIVPGLAVIGVGCVVWRNRDRPLELSSIVVAVGFVSFASASLLDLDVWVAGAVLLLFGVVLGVAAGFDLVRPSELGVAVGAIVAYIGAFTFADIDERLGPLLALAVALSLVVFAARRDDPPPLALGVAGALVAAQAVLATTFDGALAAALVALCGVALVVGVISRSIGRRAGSGS